MGETPRSASPTREGLGWFNPCQERGRLQLVKGWGGQPLSKKGAGSKPRRVGEVQPWSGRGPSPSREELSFQIFNHCCQLLQVVVRTLSKSGPSPCREGLGGSRRGPSPGREGLGGVKSLSRRGPAGRVEAPTREGWGATRKDVPANTHELRVSTFTTPWKVPEGPAGMVPLA